MATATATGTSMATATATFATATVIATESEPACATAYSSASALTAGSSQSCSTTAMELGSRQIGRWPEVGALQAAESFPASMRRHRAALRIRVGMLPLPLGRP